MMSNWSLPVNGDLILCLVVETSCFAICELRGSAELKMNVWSVLCTHACGHLKSVVTVSPWTSGVLSSAEGMKSNSLRDMVKNNSGGTL